MPLSKWQLEPALSDKGEKWWQLCYYCGKQINFIKDSVGSWRRIGGIDSKLVRHKKCYPQEAKKCL